MGSQGLFDKKAPPRLVSEDAEQLIACATCSYHGLKGHVDPASATRSGMRSEEERNTRATERGRKGERMEDRKRKRLTFNANAMAFGQQDDAEGELRRNLKNGNSRHRWGS